MSGFADLVDLKERTTTTVQLPCGAAVSVELNGYRATDNYATNLQLTGHTNWFGSLNVCNLMAETGDELFGACTSRQPLRVLELGSGLGRAGIMSAKLLGRRGQAHSVLLTDGEERVVSMLDANCLANGLVTGCGCPSRTAPGACVSEIHCRRLRWGPGAELDDVLVGWPGGFDLVLGCDLVYGPNGPVALEAVMDTVGALLATGSGQTELLSTPPSTAQQPRFLLAFTRRGAVTVEELLAAGRQRGLQGRLLEDFTFDLFDNQVDEDSLFWATTVVAFTRILAGAESN
jgi:hypothetical protein